MRASWATSENRKDDVFKVIISVGGRNIEIFPIRRERDSMPQGVPFIKPLVQDPVT